MREASFINKNKSRWELLEKSLAGGKKLSSDELSRLFIQLTDDLSYAKTFYPGSNIISYLNGLSQLLHQRIYQNKKTERKHIWQFWLFDIPLIVRKQHRQLLLSFSIFLIAVLIGAISAAHDDTFVRLILGDQYVDMTLNNIEKGKPMDVYARENGTDMFLFISWNNIKVSFSEFMMGIFISFGTVMALFYNGIMLGAFQYFFYAKGLLLPSMLTIWIHGTLEITAIIVAGAAGFALGNGILFPGTYPRLYSFKTGAMNGVKMIAGLIPVFLIAAFLEGFVTRLSPAMHPAFSSSIILLSLVFVIYYFVLYPIKLKNRIDHSLTIKHQP